MLKENLPHCRPDFNSLLARIQPALELVDPADLSQMRAQINKLAVDSRAAHIDHAPFRRAMTEGPFTQAVNDFVEYFSENGFYQKCVGWAKKNYSALDEHVIRENVFFSIWLTFFRLPEWQGEIIENQVNVYIKESLKRACMAACCDNTRGHSPLEEEGEDLEEEGEESLSTQWRKSVRPTEEEALRRIMDELEFAQAVTLVDGKGWINEAQRVFFSLLTEGYSSSEARKVLNDKGMPVSRSIANRWIQRARTKIPPPPEPRIRYIKRGWSWDRQTAEILLTTASGLLTPDEIRLLTFLKEEGSVAAVAEKLQTEGLTKANIIAKLKDIRWKVKSGGARKRTPCQNTRETMAKNILNFVLSTEVYIPQEEAMRQAIIQARGRLREAAFILGLSSTTSLTNFLKRKSYYGN